MKTENFNEFTTEDLLKKKKTTSLVTGILLGMLILLFIMSILLLLSHQATGGSLIAVVFGLSPIVILNFKTVKKMNEELNSRNLNGSNSFRK